MASNKLKMWKQKFRSRGKENQQQISAPVLVETTYDKGLLNAARPRHDVGTNGQHLQPALSSQNRPLSSGPSSSYSITTPQQTPTDWGLLTPRQSVAPSSMYSTPTPGLPPFDWSPATPQGNYQAYDVSPVDDTPGPYSHLRDQSSDSPSQQPGSRFSWATRTTEATARNQPTDSPQQLDSRFSWTTRATEAPARGQPTDSPQQLDSRFSWTTRATDTTYQSSCPPSPPPPMPSRYEFDFATPSARDLRQSSAPNPVPGPGPTSLFDRRSLAPSVTSISTAKATIRKPVAAPPATITISPTKQRAQPFPAAHQYPHPRAASTPHSHTVSTSKALPQPPTLQETTDTIDALNAQLDDLALRRKNISRVIHDLTALQPNNPLVMTLAERRESEKKVKGLEMELAEIGAAEHEFGMKMHRARKRREREEGGGGLDAIWVKRVTSE